MVLGKVNDFVIPYFLILIANSLAMIYKRAVNTISHLHKIYGYHIHNYIDNKEKDGKVEKEN